MEDLDSTTKPFRHFLTMGVCGEIFIFVISLASFVIFCKTIPQIYDEGKNNRQ